MVMTPQTQGKTLVSVFGEPTRKGGGTGWVDIWLEWEDVVLVPTPSTSISIPIPMTNAQEETEPSTSSGTTPQDQEQPGIHLGLMVTLRDPRADEIVTEEQKRKGVGGIWERAGEWVWGEIKVFRAGAGAGAKQ
jgi:hypothetical protein